MTEYDFKKFQKVVDDTMLEIHETVREKTEDINALKILFHALQSGIIEDMLIGAQENGK